MLKILIADDKLADRFLLQELLSGYGECWSVVNGHEAVEAYAAALEEASPFDLIIMDMFMPVMDGREAIERIRTVEAERNIPKWDGVKILVVTISKDVDHIKEALFQGNTSGYLVKPVARGTLESEMHKLALI